MLLEARRPVEAEVVYWQDLEKNSENGYSLFGLWKSLLVQDQPAYAVAERFGAAWAAADVELTSSRF